MNLTDPKDIKQRLLFTLQALRKNEKKLFLYVNDLHVSMTAYRQEEYRIVDVLQFLVDSSNYCCGNITSRFFLQKGIFYDVVFPYRHETIDETELKQAVTEYVNTDLRKQIFFCFTA